MPTSEEIRSAVTSCPGGVRIRCRVQPRASRNAVTGVAGTSLRIAIQAPPVDGKANQFLCNLLAEWLDRPKSACTLVSGQTSREKCIAVAGITPDEVCERLGNISR